MVGDGLRASGWRCTLDDSPKQGERVSARATSADVFANRAPWSVECGDALAWLRSLPDDSVDLLFTSPPYERARTYGIGERMVGGEEWVAWMVEVFQAAKPKVKGLIAVNCEGQTRNYSYSGVPFLLFADLKRGGFNMRKPPVFHRVGIPGSGGPDWLRNDYEPIVCVTREGRLPWSDNTACGHPPVYSPGGPMSHRLASGERKNAFGVRTDKAVGSREYGLKDDREDYRARTTSQTRRKPDGERARDGDYEEPVIANPGNVLKLAVGGGAMGSALAHENEAPFPLELPAFFILSFCPPAGVVCDPFGGSGTTIDAAVQNGRRGISCDVRESQVDLARRRMRNCTPALFTEEAA
jgi:hypothetical protein